MEILTLMKNKKYTNAVIALIAGILILVLGGSFFSADKKKTPEKSENPAYELEDRLENILSTIKGAGKVKVFIAYEDSGSFDYAKDTKQTDAENKSETENKTVFSGSGSNSSPVIVRTQTPAIKGVIVTAQGASNEYIKEKIKSAVETSLGIMPHRIEVAEGK